MPNGQEDSLPMEYTKFAAACALRFKRNFQVIDKDCLRSTCQSEQFLRISALLHLTQIDGLSLRISHNSLNMAALLQSTTLLIPRPPLALGVQTVTQGTLALLLTT
ncbi:hypothetical protein CFOL_v3_02817 [Cephalotus follicularis]|uniref:Uncharacterized protein n=1 Tax=Cephalotus follicularis TaxID=3775 RepID=A0A1Q3AU51_CEPFO|nr:hypothetical protein CFOL_v3_02817 [Cephalotus follicularis]